LVLADGVAEMKNQGTFVYIDDAGQTVR